MKNSIDGFITKRPKSRLEPQRIEGADGYTKPSVSQSSDQFSDSRKIALQRDEIPPIVRDSSSIVGAEELGPVRALDLPKPKKRRFKFSRKKALLIVFLLVLAPALYFGYRYVKALKNIGGGNFANIFIPTKLKGEDQGRVNILVSGTSEDDPGHEGAELTDSIMVISINTVDNSALMLSIPRDLWINYNDGSSLGNSGKINEAYFRGRQGIKDDKEATKAGMQNLTDVVSEVTGLDIPYYLKIDYQAFRDAVDAVGGVDVNIDSGDPYCVGGGGIYDIYTSTKLTKGVHHLSGEEALNLSRSRNAGGGCGMASSDFSRTEYQRQILIEIRKKALSAGTLSNPEKIADLLDSAGDNVYHNFEANELVRLYDIGKGINESAITSEGLNTENVLKEYRAPNGALALSATSGPNDYSKIQQFVRKLTSNDPIVKEQPSVVILNGTSISGLAAKKSETLETLGVEVIETGNASAKSYQNNQIIVLNKDKAASLNLLKEKLSPIDEADQATTADYQDKYDADFVIIVGSNDQQAQEN
jgi:LCP family protein required for cell wall assembly